MSEKVQPPLSMSVQVLRDHLNFLMESYEEFSWGVHPDSVVTIGGEPIVNCTSINGNAVVETWKEFKKSQATDD